MSIISMETKENESPITIPKLRRTSRQLCQVCLKNNVCYGYFPKCPECTRGDDAKDDWYQFKINANAKPAHVDVKEILHHLKKREDRMLKPRDAP